METVYVNVGNVRGSCGHRHWSLAAAQKCLRRDVVGCRQQGGFSDRHTRAFQVTLEERDLTEGEMAALTAYM